MTTPPDKPDPWASDPGRTPEWEQQPGPPLGAPGGQQGGWPSPPPPPGYPGGPGGPGGPGQPGWPPQQQPGWGAGQPQMPPPHPNWPAPGQPGDWSAPGYGYWGAPKNNGMGTAALVLGILAILLCWTVVGGIVLGVLALIFGLVGRGRVKRREADNGGAALAGVILGPIGALLSIVIIVIGIIAVAEDQRKYDECLEQGTAQEVCEQRYDPVEP